MPPRSQNVSWPGAPTVGAWSHCRDLGTGLTSRESAPAQVNLQPILPKSDRLLELSSLGCSRHRHEVKVSLRCSAVFASIQQATQAPYRE